MLKKIKKTLELKRELGLLEITLAGIGIILGAGIYALLGKAAGIAGTGVWISFLLAAGIAALTGLSYAELSSMFPKAGAEYVYTKRAFGRRIAFIIGWLLILGGVIGSAAVSLGFGGYLAALTGIPVVIGAFLLLIFVMIILFFGVKESVFAAIIGTIIEAGGLILIIAISLPYIGSIDYFDIPDWSGVFSGAALIFFAYIGFEQISRMAGEAKNPHSTMPKAIILAIVFTSIIYVLVAISAISVLSPEILGVSDSPLADVAAKAFSQDAYYLMAIIALFATANTVLMIQFASSRLIYGITRRYPSLSFFSWLHPKKRSPWAAIILATIIAGLFVFSGGIEMVAYLTDFTIFTAFIAVNGALIWLRYKQPNLKRPFKVPTLAIPILGALSSFIILFTMPQEIIFYGLGLLALGFIGYELCSGDKIPKK